MKLPKWEVLKANYPAVPADQAFEAIGGKVLYNHQIGVFTNACSTRVSAALNGSGKEHEIPFFRDNNKTQVSSGENKKWYIFRVRMLTKYLTERYGEAEFFGAEEYQEKIAGRKGIIIFEVKGWDDATGHADLWDGSACLWQGYGELAHKILFWEAEEEEQPAEQTSHRHPSES